MQSQQCNISHCSEFRCPHPSILPVYTVQYTVQYIVYRVFEVQGLEDSSRQHTVRFWREDSCFPCCWSAICHMQKDIIWNEEGGPNKKCPRHAHSRRENFLTVSIRSGFTSCLFLVACKISCRWKDSYHLESPKRTQHLTIPSASTNLINDISFVIASDQSK